MMKKYLLGCIFPQEVLCFRGSFQGVRSGSRWPWYNCDALARIQGSRVMRFCGPGATGEWAPR